MYFFLKVFSFQQFREGTLKTLITLLEYSCKRPPFSLRTFSDHIESNKRYNFTYFFAWH